MASSSRSNRLSRLLPFNNSNQSPSIYETIQQHDESSDSSDVEERAAMAVDEENLRHPFEDHELDDVLERGSDTQSTHSGGPFVRRLSSRRRDRARGEGAAADDQTRHHPWPPQPTARERETAEDHAVVDDEHDDVPPSFLVQKHDDPTPPEPPPAPSNYNRDNSDIPAAGPSTPRLRDQWNTARSRQPLHAQQRQQQQEQRQQQHPTGKWRLGQHAASQKERALWRWANVENLDNFVKDVYVYFLENGIWCIVLGRALNLL